MKPILLAFVLAAVSACPAAETVSLTSLDLGHLHFEGWGKPQTDKSFGGKPLSVAGQKFEHGIGTRALSTLWLELDGRVEKFVASVGVDDGAPNEAASVCFSIIGDGKKLWISGTMKRGEPAKRVDLNLKGVRSLLLKVDPLMLSVSAPSPNLMLVALLTDTDSKSTVSFRALPTTAGDTTWTRRVAASRVWLSASSAWLLPIPGSPRRTRHGVPAIFSKAFWFAGETVTTNRESDSEKR